MIPPEIYLNLPQTMNSWLPYQVECLFASFGAFRYCKLVKFPLSLSFQVVIAMKQGPRVPRQTARFVNTLLVMIV